MHAYADTWRWQRADPHSALERMAMLWARMALRGVALRNMALCGMTPCSMAAFGRWYVLVCGSIWGLAVWHRAV